MAARAAAIALMAIIAAVTAAPLAQRAASTTATDTPVGTPPVGMLPPLARHRRGGYTPLPRPYTQCAGNPATYDAGYGGCSTYAVGHKTKNNDYCAQDINKATGEVAESVCRECGACTTGAAFTCTKEHGIQYGSSDHFDKYKNTKSYEGCMKKCEQNDRCTYFVYSPQNGYGKDDCWLKDDTKYRKKKDNHRATSGKCTRTGTRKETTTTTTTTTTTATKPRSCKDTYANCQDWQRAGFCTNKPWMAWMATNCRSACGLCNKWNVPFTCTKEHGIQYGSKAIDTHKHTKSYEGCMKKCEQNHKCTYFVYSPHYGASDCWLKDDTIAKAEGYSFRKPNWKATGGKCTRK